jgi:tetratricopeptide (TPR) repeat protein
MMGIRRRIVAALCVTALVASPLYAQPPTPTPQQKQAAGDLTKQAIAKSQAGEYEKAIELHLQAYAIVPLPLLLTNIASDYQKLKKPVEALKYFCMYLKEDPTGQSASYATAQAKLIQFEAGNKDVTDATVCDPPKPKEEPVIVQEPPPVVETSPPEDRGKGLRIAGLAIGGAGVVSLGVGIFFGFKAKDISDQITNHPMDERWPDKIQDLEDEGQAHENKQIVLMIAGGALVATGVALYFIGRSRKGESASISLVPTATPESAGIALTGGF